MKRRTLLLAAGPGAVGASPLVLRMAGGRSDLDPRYQSMRSLLDLLMDAAGLRWTPHWVADVSQPRIVTELQAGRLDLAMLPSSTPGLEALPVLRHPLRRGLPGARLLLTRRELVPSFAPVKSLEELRRWRLGYGADSPDLPGMRAQGFDIVTGSSYRGLFEMLVRRRFDWLHRGVDEIWQELDTPGLLPRGLAVVPQLALFYPLDDYFVLGPHQAALLPRLQRAWAQCRQDGRYARWFQTRYGETLRRAALAQRRVLHLAGMGVLPGTPLLEFDALRLSPTRGELGLD